MRPDLGPQHRDWPAAAVTMASLIIGALLRTILISFTPPALTWAVIAGAVDRARPASGAIATGASALPPAGGRAWNAAVVA